MKRINLIASLALALAGTQVQVNGQGTVNFANDASTAVTNPLTMQRIVVGTIFRVELYYLPDQATEPTFNDMQRLAGAAPGAFGPLPGLFIAGTRTATGTPGGGFAWFQVRCWETAFGTSYQAAVDNQTPINGRLALVGYSNIIRVKTGDPSVPTTPGSLVGYGLQRFIFVPEPATIGLAALGIGALLLFRRRK